jgi:hypothetical protein
MSSLQTRAWPRVTVVNPPPPLIQASEVDRPELAAQLAVSRRQSKEDSRFVEFQVIANRDTR